MRAEPLQDRREAVSGRDFHDLNFLEEIYKHIEQKGIALEEAISFFKKKKNEKDRKIPKYIPVSILTKNKLSALEAIVKYLKENFSLTYSEIAFILNRNDRTIWATYSNSKKKMSQKLDLSDSRIKIPLSIIASRKASVLESISLYLHESKNLPYHKIALMLNRDQRTVWTVCNRARKKKNV